MNKTYAIREYSREDFDFVVSSYIEVFSVEPWNDQLTITQIEAYLQNMTEMNTFIGYIFENTSNNQSVGCALGFVRPWYQGKEYQMDTFYIVNDYQNEGVGGSFLTSIKESLYKKGIPTIMLDTDKGTPAEKFYLKHDFTSPEEAVTFYASTKQ